MNPIVVMPDFFVDRVIKLKSKEEFFNMINNKANLGGGSIRGVPTTDIKGGNATNVAYCLAKLGVKVALFTIADDIGAAILRQTFSRFGKNVNLMVTCGRHGSTTAFELLNEKVLRFILILTKLGEKRSF